MTGPALDARPGARASRRTLTNLADVAAEVVTTLAPTAASRGVRLRLAVGRDEAVVAISCDRVRAREIVAALVSHAVWHTLPGADVEVSVHFHAAPFGERLAMVSVADRSAAGLAVVQRTAVDMGGSIVVDSDAGAGSVFTFVLPMAD